MTDYYWRDWYPNQSQHDWEEHQENKENALPDISCPICHGTSSVNTEFEIFWEAYKRVFYGKEFTKHTVRSFDQLKVLITTDDAEDRLLRIRLAAEIITESIRYEKEPPVKRKELAEFVILCARILIEENQETDKKRK
jgi:hypothetical protein